MRKFFFALLPLAICALSGCAYHGAVYSEYSQVALDLRTSAASSAPIKVGLGYDRGVMAYVPKLEGKAGEACSIISWENISTVVSPSLTSTSSVLRVDSGFIAGTAATVASAPADMRVVLVPAPNERASEVPLLTKGEPGERIAAALTPMVFGQDPNTAIIRDWLKADRATNVPKLKTWLAREHLEQFGVTHILDDAVFAPTRQKIVDQLVKTP